MPGIAYFERKTARILDGDTHDYHPGNHLLPTMANIPSRRAWNVAIISGLCAALLGVVALVIDTLQGDAMNWAVLPAIGAGLLVALLALAQLKKT